MHYHTTELLTIISQRPAAPPAGASKGTLLEFKAAYAAWLPVLDAMVANVKESDAYAIAEAERNKPDDYRTDAQSDAAEMAEHFLDEIVEKLCDDGEASDDFNNDYDDSYHHESHVDKSYSVKEAVAVLDQLDEHEETDSGLWEGQEWERVLETKAAFTYGNAVASNWNDLIEKINEAYDDAVAALGDSDAYSDPELAANLRGELEAGEVAETDEVCAMQLAIVQAVIDAKPEDAEKAGLLARKAEIRKLVEQTIEDYKR